LCSLVVRLSLEVAQHQSRTVFAWESVQLLIEDASDAFEIRGVGFTGDLGLADSNLALVAAKRAGSRAFRHSVSDPEKPVAQEPSIADRCGFAD
jgi:hypothetical protein